MWRKLRMVYVTSPIDGHFLCRGCFSFRKVLFLVELFVILSRRYCCESGLVCFPCTTVCCRPVHINQRGMMNVRSGLKPAVRMQVWTFIIRCHLRLNFRVSLLHVSVLHVCFWNCRCVGNPESTQLNFRTVEL